MEIDLKISGEKNGNAWFVSLYVDGKYKFGIKGPMKLSRAILEGAKLIVQTIKEKA